MYRIVTDAGIILHDSRLEEYQVINPILSLALNTSGELKFKLPKTHYAYNSLHKRKTEVMAYRDDELIFCGQVIDSDTALDGSKEIACEGELGYFHDSIMRPWDWNGDPQLLFTKIIELHNAQMAEERKKFSVGIIDVTDKNDVIVRSDSTYLSGFETLASKFYNSALGGFVRTRHKSDGTRVIDYTVAPGGASSQTIEFASNILDFSEFIDGAEIATALVPLGAQMEETTTNPVTGEDETHTWRVDISSVNNGSDYIVDEDAVELYGLVFAKATFDGVTTPEMLLTRAYEALASLKMLNVTIDITALDLSLLDVDTDALRLGDTVSVISKPHGVDEMMVISAVELDMARPEGSKYTLGSKSKTLSETVANDVSNTATEIIAEVKSEFATNEQLADVRHNVIRVESEIAQSAEQIFMHVGEEFATKSSLEETETRLNAEMQIEADNVTLKFDEFSETIRLLDEATAASFDEVHTYIRFDTSGMELGSLGSPFIAKLSNEELAFLQNGQRVAYINNRKLYITDAEVLKSLQIGKFAYIPRANGNTSFRWIGG